MKKLLFLSLVILFSSCKEESSQTVALSLSPGSWRLSFDLGNDKELPVQLKVNEDHTLTMFNADEEITALTGFNPTRDVIIDKRFKDYYGSWTNAQDAEASIVLTSYEPEVLSYHFNSKVDQMVVFSEIYYHGNTDWMAYVDGVEQDHFRVNYVLRGMVIPKGEHKIEFKFRPEIYYIGEKISLAGSGIIVILLLVYLGKSFRKPKEVA